VLASPPAPLLGALDVVQCVATGLRFFREPLVSVPRCPDAIGGSGRRYPRSGPSVTTTPRCLSMLAGMGGTIWDGAMIAALAAARAAAVFHDVPVGAVVLDPGGDVVATAGNEREQRQDPTAHAEVLALRAAAQSAGTWRLDGHTLVVTLEPCTMCAGALVLARIPTLVFGAYDPKAGAVASLFDVVRDPRLNHRVDVRGGILEAECAQVLLDFFAGHRAKS